MCVCGGGGGVSKYNPFQQRVAILVQQSMDGIQTSTLWYSNNLTFGVMTNLAV